VTARFGTLPWGGVFKEWHCTQYGGYILNLKWLQNSRYKTKENTYFDVVVR
jgi:hypothetical protein